MGLDMYLYLEHYESKHHDYEHQENNVAGDFYPKELRTLGDKHIKHNFLSKETKYQVGYWRKANAIHKWFVDYSNREDDCRDILVDKKALKDLRDICVKVKNDHSLAPMLLPTEDGFFFGSTEYGDWYFQDIDYTIDMLNDVISFLDKNDHYWDCIYCASW